MKLVNATDVSDVVFKTSKKLFDEMWDLTPIRLIGVRLDKLVNVSNVQVSLFENIKTDEEAKELQSTLDKLQEKYGSAIIKKASLTGKTISKKYLK